MLSEHQWFLTDKICPDCDHPQHYCHDEGVHWCFYCRHRYVPRKTYKFPNIEVSPDQAYVRAIERSA